MELLVALLIIAGVSITLFSVALTGRQAPGRIERRAAASLAGKKVLESLKDYVTADIAGPAGPGVAPNGWGLRGDSCGCWALAVGQHRLDASIWMPGLAAAPYNGTIAYTVTQDGEMPTAALDISWTEDGD